MPSPSDLPPWLRQAGARSVPAGSARRGRAASVARAVAAVALLGVGFGGGLTIAGRRAQPVPAAAAPAPACPPQPVCSEPGAAARHGALAAAPTRRAKPPATALRPLPARQPLDETQRTQALRAFAESRGPELRECLSEPDRGPPRKLGAAFEIDGKGTVDSVQILGADSSPRAVLRCYAGRLKRWKFPEELLRGDEKLLVTFVL